MLQEKAQDRERLLLKFIKIMKVAAAAIPGVGAFESRPGALGLPHGRLSLSLQHLRKLNNFNSYLAILSALDSAPIRRLEWQKQTSEVSGWEGGRPAPGDQPWGKALRCPLGRQPPPHPAPWLAVAYLRPLGPEGLRGWGWGCPLTGSCCLAAGPYLGPRFTACFLLEGLLRAGGSPRA